MLSINMAAPLLGLSGTFVSNIVQFPSWASYLDRGRDWCIAVVEIFIYNIKRINSVGDH